MKIGLIDVDLENRKRGPTAPVFPNHALMKISAYYKSLGSLVEWCNPMMQYDAVYVSKVFDDTPEMYPYLKADEVLRGGRAYDKKLKLDSKIECVCPDYSLYNIKNIAYGYLTRGCPRQCDFCDVKNIEGIVSYKVYDLKQFWNGQHNIKLLDPNLLACKDRIELLQQLVDSKASIDFTQGLDIRFMTDEIINLIMKMKISIIHFAWDKEKDSDIILKNLEHFKNITGLGPRKLSVYTLTNFDTTFEFDMYRITTLRKMGYDPYVMIYDKQNAPKIYRKLERWVNCKQIFRAVNNFEEYKQYSTNNEVQIWQIHNQQTRMEL